MGECVTGEEARKAKSYVVPDEVDGPNSGSNSGAALTLVGDLREELKGQHVMSEHPFRYCG